MSSTNQSPLSPEDLNKLWDAAVDGKTNEESLSESQEASIIHWLRATAPAPIRSEHAWSQIVAAVNTSPVPPTHPADSRLGQAQRKTNRPQHWGQIASGALAIALVAAILFAPPTRDLWQPDRDEEFGTGTEEASTDFPPNSGRSLLSIAIQPGDAPMGAVSIGFWDVTMPPDSVLLIPTAIQTMGNHPLEGWVESGTVIAGASGFEHEVHVGNTTAMEPAPEYFRNAESVDARLLMLVPMQPDDVFPLRFSDWPGDSVASPPAVDHAGTNVHLVDVVTLDSAEAFQFRVNLAAATFEPGDSFDQTPLSPMSGSTLHSLTVLHGEMTDSQNSTESSPAVVARYSEGDTVVVDGTSQVPTFAATGNENLTLLSLSTTPWSENPTLDQTVDPVALTWGEWEIPDSGNYSISVELIHMAPDTSYKLAGDFGVAYVVLSDAVTVENSGRSHANTVGRGGVVAQNPGEVLYLSNHESEYALVGQVVIYEGSLEDIQHQSVHAGPGTGTSRVETILTVNRHSKPGSLIFQLDVGFYDGQNMGGSGGSLGNGIALITALEGNILASRDGGSAIMIPSQDSEAIEAPLGQKQAIQPGGYLLAEPGSSYSSTGSQGAPSTSLIVSVNEAEEPQASPSTPVARDGTVDPSQSVSITGVPENCTVVALTTHDIEMLMATPAVLGSPLERSTQNRRDGLASTDVHGPIMDLLQDYVECTATYDYARIFGFFSDQAIRESPNIQEMVLANHSPGEAEFPVSATVEDIVLFPDGRAGARVVIDGEAAYLTFIQENGEWVIDVWDDSGANPSQEASPIN